ncbi:MAG: FAD-dependent oxidoreductase, partial [Streptosporangiaceae bacterium]
MIVQMHQCAASSSSTGNGSDLGIRKEWLPLFDRYQVDLVLCGHDHDYERSLPGARRRYRRRPRGGHRGRGQHPAPVPGDDDRQRGVRHQARHRAPHPRLRRHRRPAGRVRHRHCRQSAPGQGVHQVRPARRHVRTRRLHPGGGGRGGRRRLVGQSRHGHRLRDRCLRRRPGPRLGRPAEYHGHPLPRGRRGPGQPGHRRQGGADPRLHRVRDLHPGPSALARAAFHRRATGYGRLMDVLVIGAGAVGLTTAISLAEAGLSVTIRTAALPAQTTSVAAGAVWG